MPDNFHLNEFSCPCCGGNDIKPELVARLDKARDIAGLPFKIDSGWRCEAHNKEVGGEEKSSHMNGWAADIFCASSAARFNFLESLQRAGFNRFGIGKNFIHVDCDPDKPTCMIWVY